MRTFIPSSSRDQTGKRQERQRRLSTEWDIGLNLIVGEESVGSAIIKAYGEAQATKEGSCIEYLLISGVEYTDQTKEEDNTTRGNPHVHVALVVKEPINKSQALSLLRPIRIGVKEYATPRNKTWPYYGWRIHHTKLDTKVDKNVRILYEYGTLPPDIWTDAQIKRTNKIVWKHGCPVDKAEWSVVRERIQGPAKDQRKKERDAFKELENAKQQAERYQMMMEDLWEQSRNTPCTLQMQEDEEDEEEVNYQKARRAFFQRKNRIKRQRRS